MKTVRTADSLRHHVESWKRARLRSAVVPTMGALHDGHLNLIRQGMRLAEKVVVTIFINPKQFAANEDLDFYPRDEQGDLEKLRQAGVDVVFMPSIDVMYPEGFATSLHMEGPATCGLEDRFRPHFFNGVATVVAKLFIQSGCDYAMFGEKDYQQLKVVTRMARDLNLPISVIGIETVRDEDGLAMSSRNAYLSKDERRQAPLIYQALNQAASDIRNGTPAQKAAEAGGRYLEENGFKLDYFEARNAESLQPLKTPEEPIRLLAAAHLSSTRLIDNIGV